MTVKKVQSHVTRKRLGNSGVAHKMAQDSAKIQNLQNQFLFILSQKVNVILNITKKIKEGVIKKRDILYLDF